MQDGSEPGEAPRLQALRSLDVFGTAPEPRFDRIAGLTADLFDAPMALVALIGADTVWLKARFGLEAEELPRGALICDELVGDACTGPWAVADAAADARFHGHPMVTQAPHVRFCAGAPLATGEGFAIGMLYVLDAVPRPVPARRDLDRLATLAALVIDAFTLRRGSRASGEAECLLGAADPAADLVLQIGLDGAITYASPSAAVLAGHPPSVLVGRQALGFVEPRDRRRLLGRALRLRRPSRPAEAATVAIRATRPDGTSLPLESRLTLASDRDGRPIGWVGVLRRDGTRPQHEGAVASPRALAEAEAKARSDLLADMSHELRTPLNGIIGFTQVLKRDGTLGDERLRVVERIEDAGYNLLGIVGDVLELSKLASGAVQLRPQPFDLTRLLEDAVALVRFEADRKGLDLVLDLPAEPLGPLVGDSARLRQVVLNLLSNAVKFTTAGAVRVSLAVRDEPGPMGDRPPEAAPALRASIVVEDSGVGISAASLPKLFRRYGQADGSVSRRFGGTGLGLAISKTLTEAMGGTIAVASALGAGSRFSITLALPRGSDRDRSAGRAAVRRRAKGERDILKGAAILLAEDIAMNQKLARLMLQPLGADIDVVANGHEAVAAVRQKDYALVLMDMEMPVLDGLAAARRIRALEGPHASVPIVALTANVFPEQMAQCREAGMDDCLTKPFRPDELVGIVLKWARRRAPADAPGD